MKIKKLVAVLGISLCLSPLVYAEDGATLFKAKCAACHQTSRPNDISTLVAPPVMGIMRHMKMTYKTKEDAVKFISTYALNPQKSKAVCMPQKIKRFGLMPSQKENVTEKELESIASWMFDNFPQKGFMGKGHGKSCSVKQKDIK